MTLAMDPINIIIIGVGGQGTILMSRLLAKALIHHGYRVILTDDVGVAQRAGSVASTLRFSKFGGKAPQIPRGKGHIIVGMEPLETLRRIGEYGNPDLVTVTNMRPQLPAGALLRRDVYPDIGELKGAIQTLSKQAWFVNATEIALELGNPLLTNVVLMGSLIGKNLLPIGKEDVEMAIGSLLKPKLVDLNLKAFSKGFSLVI